MNKAFWKGTSIFVVVVFVLSNLLLAPVQAGVDEAKDSTILVCV